MPPIALADLLRREMAIGATVSAMLMPAIGWLVFGGLPVVPVWGKGGLARDFLPSTIGPTLVMTVLLSGVIHRRQRLGEFAGMKLPALVASVAPRCFVPLVVRAILLALLAVVTLALPAAGCLWLTGLHTVTGAQLICIKLVYGALSGALLSPVIVVLALFANFRKIQVKGYL